MLIIRYLKHSLVFPDHKELRMEFVKVRPPLFYICLVVLALLVISADYGACQTNAEGENSTDEAEAEVVDKGGQKADSEQTFQFDFVAAEVFEYKGLVEVRSLGSSIEVELIYATTENFTGQVLYNIQACLLRRSTAEKLAKANAEFAQDGYRLKVWDAYRPRSAQEIMWNVESNDIYVADPAVGSNHTRGASVDVTLVDELGNELPMPTGFDDFTEKASRYYPDIP